MENPFKALRREVREAQNLQQQQELRNEIDCLVKIMRSQIYGRMNNPITVFDIPKGDIDYLKEAIKIIIKEFEDRVFFFKLKITQDNQCSFESLQTVDEWIPVLVNSSNHKLKIAMEYRDKMTDRIFPCVKSKKHMGGISYDKVAPFF